MKTPFISFSFLFALAFFLYAPSALAWNCLGGNGGGCGGPGELDFTPQLSITATPQSITEGQSTYVSWTGTWVTDCSANFTYTNSWGNGTGLVGGYTTDYPSQARTYTVTCTGNDNTGSNPHPISASVTVTVTPATGIELSAGAISPTTVTGGVPSLISASISNLGTVGTSGGFTNLFQYSNADAGALPAYDIGTYVRPGPLAASSNFSATLSYTFPAVTSPSYLYVRACADKSSGTNTGTVAETNEANNCGPWTYITIVPAVNQCTDGTDNDADGRTDASDPACQTCSGTCTESSDPSVSCTPSPSTISAVPTTVVYTPTVMNGSGSYTYAWSPSAPDTTCTGSNPASCTIRTPGNHAMAVTATGAGGSFSGSCTVAASCTADSLSITANPARVKNASAVSTITWSAASSCACTVTGPGISPQTGVSGSVQATGITHQNTYTLACGGHTKTVIVNSVPTFDEF